MKHISRIFAALLLATTVACDTDAGSTVSQKHASTTAEADEEKGATNEAPESDESDESDEGGEAPAAEESTPSELPRGEAPERAPLEKELAAMEAQADQTLFEGERCKGFSDLQKCQRDEAKEEWRTAATCYRNFVVVGGPKECRVAQFVKAAANFERADSRQGAIAARMQVVKVGEKFTAAAVDAADYMIENGQVERARVFYNSYRNANPEGALLDYVDRQCERVDGCADQVYPPQ